MNPRTLSAPAAQWLETDVDQVPGVGTRAAQTLRSAFGIETVRDLLEHYPHRYNDLGALVPLRDAALGKPVTLVGTVTSWDISRPRGRKLTIARARLVDDEGAQVDVPFFNQEWRATRHPEGSRLAVTGVLEQFKGRLQVRNPKLVELDDPESGDVHERIQPVYPATEALASPRIASFVAAALDRLGPLPDYLPDVLRARHGLLDLDTALRHIHRPPDLPAARTARARLVYDELLCLQVGLQQRRHRLESEAQGLEQAPVPGGLAARLVEGLPFIPTGAQQRAFAEIGADLARPKPMHRLLQGEVGAGKTLVAAWTMLCAVDHGRQAVLMAPTAVLAEQHYRTFTRLLAPLGVNLPSGPRLELLTGATPARHLRGLLAELAVGDVQLLIATHAVLEEHVRFFDLGVVVVDEQHRFGVEHRTRLRDKRAAGAPDERAPDERAPHEPAHDRHAPDVLVMTATPIPRSLALTLYGDLDVTVLDELPPGREPVTTQVIASDSPRRAALYDYLRERVTAHGERAYIVCPLVEESEVLDVASAEDTHRRLSQDVFPELRVELVHGRLPAAERDARMDAFREGDAPILVATTVIEVGVDVPEATIMVIEDAHRFGISQLHQLRGRVGRSAGQRSFCVLFADDPDNPRLDALARTSDGFRLAEVDLELRGEGSLFDTRQSGLPDLKLATLVRDFECVVASREDARALVDADPSLHSHPALRAEVRRRYGEERLQALETG